MAHVLQRPPARTGRTVAENTPTTSTNRIEAPRLLPQIASLRLFLPSPSQTLGSGEMLGGLYGDLPPPSSSGDDDKASTASVWSSATKMAPPTLRKPSTTFAPPPSLLRNQHLRPPKAASASASAAPAAEPAPVLTPAASFQPAFVAVQSVMEEYDPARPNDYEDYRKDKLRRAKEAELSKELERRRREEQEREKEREQREREAREREERDHQSRASSLNISGEEAWKRRAAMSGSGGAAAAQRTPSSPPHGDGFAIGSSSSAGLGLGAGGQMTAAQRMMAKMGWKEGQGLGKQEQGITAPLVAKKTDRRGGVIVDESSSKPPEKKPKSVTFDGPPTRVLLLRNMVNTFSKRSASIDHMLHFVRFE